MYIESIFDDNEKRKVQHRQNKSKYRSNSLNIVIGHMHCNNIFIGHMYCYVIFIGHMY
jgi:hypothetical protein